MTSVVDGPTIVSDAAEVESGAGLGPALDGTETAVQMIADPSEVKF